MAGAAVLALVLEWYGTTSEVPWLFLLATLLLALVLVSLGYAAWNQAGLRLSLRMTGATPAPDSPALDLPEQLVRACPFPAPVFERDGAELAVELHTAGGARGPAAAAGDVAGAPVEIATGVVPRGGWRRTVQVAHLRRGVLQAEAWVLKSGDPLGFFRAIRRCSDAELGVVLPRFTSLSSRRTTRELEASAPAARAGSGTELFGVREYRAGDALRRIHWRSSARRGELVVREYEPPGAQTVAILCDPSPRDAETADQVARLAASEAWDCLRDGGRVLMWAPGLEGTAPSEARSLWHLLEWLGRYPDLEDSTGDAPVAAEVVVIAASADAALLEDLDAARRRGAQARAWVVGEATLDTDAPVTRVGTGWPL